MIETQILGIDDHRAIPLAKEIIRRGGLIAFPTDTIYGVACDAFNPQAIEALYAAKERPDEKALPVLIGDYRQLAELILNPDRRLEQITAAFWPGPLTVVLPKSTKIPPQLSAFTTIGIRMPNYQFTLDLLRETGPLATTSANRSGGPNPIDAESVITQLWGRIDLIIDGGPTPGPTASTVVDLSGVDIRILRPGPISLSELQSAVKPE
jgi:L-threonylcarbamoyladenylate synthase